MLPHEHRLTHNLKKMTGGSGIMVVLPVPKKLPALPFQMHEQVMPASSAGHAKACTVMCCIGFAQCGTGDGL